jgi:DNA invertase Pin-like site-specific DNA recombinase
MLIGYARVSTQDQNLELQTEALAKAGCKKIFEDKISGSRAERPGLAKAQESLREGDTLVVWKLDRLGRGVKNLVDLVSELHKQGVQFKSLPTRSIRAPHPDASSSTSWPAWRKWSGSSPSSGLAQASK